ncbi:MAG: glycosyltransferase family 39 protein [Gemmataceae bacterium]
MATIPCGSDADRSDEQRDRLMLRRLTFSLLAIGVLWRLVRYFLRFPIWDDEAFICLNFLELDYAGLTHELRNCQVAPLLFLWGELTSLRLFGASELSMRLIPFLAGLTSLLMFWRLARLTLPPLARTIAVGFLAVAIWPVSMGAFTKPYALDLCMSLFLLLPAAHWLHHPHQQRWLILLSLVTPLALFSSYPVVFVAGAVSLALMATAWRQDWNARLLWVVYNGVLLAAFLGHYLIAGQSQLHSPDKGATTEQGMQDFWAEGFPPANPLSLAKWLVLAHTGQMMAFPIGAQDGGSALTTLLCLIGTWHFWTSRRRPLLVLCLAPFGLGLLAAVLHRYPYGASCRLCQHLAPVICLSAGMGVAVLLERIRSATLRRRWILGVCTLLFLVGVGGMVRDVIHPYRTLEALWTRQVMQALDAELRSGASIVVLNKPEEMDSLFRWYLEQYGDRVSWSGQIDWEKATASGELFCLCYDYHKLSAPEQMPLSARRDPMNLPIGAAVRLDPSQPAWILVQGVTDTSVPPDWRFPVKHLHQMRLVLKESAKDGSQKTVASR